MMKNIYFTFCALLFTVVMSGCSKDIEEYNKPAIYWYTKIVESVSNGNLERADNYYSSLQGEHIGSPLLPEATMILAIAHMQDEEYILTEHFLDEYNNRYANPVQWYRGWFEGDGTSSWYAFLIPDTQSVVSRNSVQDEDTNETR